jgi:citrate synthase
LIIINRVSLLTAAETADRLGVKLPTVYAYVSRGHLRSRRKPGSRRSWFDAAEVERLARRGRPRRTTRPPALDFTIETALTSIDDHDVRYRGRSALVLARTDPFEAVAE